MATQLLPEPEIHYAWRTVVEQHGKLAYDMVSEDQMPEEYYIDKSEALLYRDDCTEVGIDTKDWVLVEMTIKAA